MFILVKVIFVKEKIFPVFLKVRQMTAYAGPTSTNVVFWEF